MIVDITRYFILPVKFIFTLCKKQNALKLLHLILSDFFFFQGKAVCKKKNTTVRAVLWFDYGELVLRKGEWWGGGQWGGGHVEIFLMQNATANDENKAHKLHILANLQLIYVVSMAI